MGIGSLAARMPMIQDSSMTFSHLIHLFQRIAVQTEGASAAEYAILTALLLPVVVAGISMLDVSLISFFTMLGARIAEIGDVLAF